MKKTRVLAFFLTITFLVCFSPTLHAKLTEDDFENVQIIPEKEALMLHWNIDYETFNRIQEKESYIIIAYAGLMLLTFRLMRRPILLMI